MRNIYYSLFRGADTLITQARDWEARAEYNRAIDLYLRITADMTNNKVLLEEVYTKAIELSVKFSKDRAVSIAHEVCKRLIDVDCYNAVSIKNIMF